MRSMLGTAENSSQSFTMFVILVVFVVPCVLLLAERALAAQQNQQKTANQTTIDRIEIVGNRRVESGTLRMRISSAASHPYNAEQVERDAQALRDAGFFDEVRSEVRDDPDDANGKIVIFYLIEKPVIRRIEYGGIRSISQQELLRAFKEKKIGLSVEAYFDQTQLTLAADLIKELLAAHGHPSASVKPTYERTATTNMVTIVFNVNEGPKVSD